MDEEHVNELRRLGALSPRIGRRLPSSASSPMKTARSIAVLATCSLATRMIGPSGLW